MQYFLSYNLRSWFSGLVTSILLPGIFVALSAYIPSFRCAYTCSLIVSHVLFRVKDITGIAAFFSLACLEWDIKSCVVHRCRPELKVK